MDTVRQTLDEMPYAYGAPVGRGRIRSTPEDFEVDEIIGFEADGEGEHVLLHVRKRETNTLWLAGRIADLAGVKPREVSYAGLKDRHAVTTQWFSVRLAGRPEPDWSRLESDEIQVLRTARHRRKLRTGALRGNRFRLSIRDLDADPEALELRLQRLREGGMPNYFGEQRFGIGYSNLEQAQALFEGRLQRIDRKLRGLLISAARSQLFNSVLARRIEEQNWHQPLPGDYMNLDGSRSGFAVEQVDEVILQRCRELDIHPSGPLWGRGRPLVTDAVLDLETEVLNPFADWRNGLEHVGLKQDRRPLRVSVADLAWEFPAPGSCSLSFTLPAGSYATVLLRELIRIPSPN